MTTSPTLQNPATIRRTIWSANLSSLLIIALIPGANLFEVSPVFDPANPLVAVLAGAVTFGTLVGAYMVLRIGPQTKFAKETFDPDNIKHQQALTAFYVLAWALTESIGIIGLVAFLLTGSKMIAWSMLAVAFVALLLQRPSTKWQPDNRQSLSRSLTGKID